jgi:hypothetical protein
MASGVMLAPLFAGQLESQSVIRVIPRLNLSVKRPKLRQGQGVHRLASTRQYFRDAGRSPSSPVVRRRR